MKGLDVMFRRSLPIKVFSKGWGDPTLIKKIIENHKKISKRETCMDLIKSFDVKLSKEIVNETSTVVEGHFTSPFYTLLPDSMNKENQEARFQLIVPNSWTTKYKPLCIMYARTGDHKYINRKMYFANQLIKDGIASLIHTNPYYGSRKPKDQWGSSLNYVSDLFVMGGALIMEGQVLFHWAKSQGFGPLAIQGISMGGYMACLAASVYSEPICLIPCLSGTTASHVYIEGAMNHAVSWKILSDQYHNDSVFSKSIRSQIEPPIPHHLQKFTKILPIKESLENNVTDREGDSIDNERTKFHLVTPDLGNENIFQSYSSDIIKDDSGTNKSPINFIQGFSPTEFPSLMRSFIDFTKLRPKYFSKATSGKLSTRNDSNFPPPLYPKTGVDNETVEFMRDILDFFTHLGNYSIPVDTRLVTSVIADSDKYILVDGVAQFDDVWNSNIDIEVLKGWDHIGSNLGTILFLHSKFRDAIIKTLNRYVELYHNEPGPFGKRK